MKKQLCNILALALLSFCVINDVEAIGGRGGGARGGSRGPAGGRIGGGGFASPSMSRADFGSRQRAAQNPAFNRNQLQQYVQNRPADNRPGFSNTISDLNRTNGRTAAQVSAQFRQQYPNAGDALRNRANNAYLWRNLGWASTAAWMGLGTYDDVYPAYYYDATGIPVTLTPQQAVTYAPNIIVTPQQPSESSQVSDPAQTIATGEWLPLGVYAVGSTAEDAPYSSKVMQLSLSKTGYLSGIYYNAATDKSYQMEGMVDKKSQEAIWKTSDDPESPVVWTGLYNLTQDVADVQVRFPNGTSQTKVLVRLKN